jgi:hypothetical protein
MKKRWIGLDLHRNQFTACVRLENGRTYVQGWKLEGLPQFVKSRSAVRELATGGSAGNQRQHRFFVFAKTRGRWK